VPLNSRAAFAAPQGASSLRNPWDTPPSKQEKRMPKRQSAETNMPSPEKHINTISVPAQQFLVPSTIHSAPSASLSKRLPVHDCSADLVVNIGPVAGICRAPSAAHVLAIHVTASAAAAVMAFQARPADLLSPAKAQVTKRLRASSKQDIKNVADMAEASRATHHKDALHHAERRGLSFGTNDFKSDDRDRQIDLLVQVLPDDCIQRLLNEDWESLNNMEPKTVLSLFRLKANAKGWSAQAISRF